VEFHIVGVGTHCEDIHRGGRLHGVSIGRRRGDVDGRGKDGWPGAFVSRWQIRTFQRVRGRVCWPPPAGSGVGRSWLEAVKQR
jgi:hypothetical protein